MPPDLRIVVQQFWLEHSTDDSAALVDTLLADPILARLAVEYAVNRLRCARVDMPVRVRLMQQSVRSNGAKPIYRVPMQSDIKRDPFIDELINRGLTLMDMRMGALKLGDYRPEDLSVYGGKLIKSSKTSLLHGRFAVMVADACPRPGEPIRDQLSLDAIEEIRDAIMSRTPDADVARAAFTVKAELLEATV